MRLAEVIGRVTLSRSHPSLRGATWRIVTPLGRTGLAGDASGRGEPLIMFDQLGSGDGSLVAISDGAEASAPFHPDQKPIDAYCAALLDTITLEHKPSDRRPVQ